MKVYLHIPDQILWPSHHTEKGVTIWAQYGFIVEYGEGEDKAVFCIHYEAKVDDDGMPHAWMPVGKFPLPSAADYPFSIRDYRNLAEQGYIDRISREPDKYRMEEEAGSEGVADTLAVSPSEGPKEPQGAPASSFTPAPGDLL